MKRKVGTQPKVRRPIVVGTGLLALDAIVSADESIPVQYSAGGTFGNVLISLSYLGWNSQPVARLAKDYAAELLCSDMKRWRLSDRFVRLDEDGSTPVIVERISKNVRGEPIHSFSWRCPTCGARYPSYKPELVTIAEQVAPKLKDVAVFFFDRVSAGALVLAKAAKAAGALVVFEPAGIGNPIHFRQAWEIAHVIKYSHERLSDFPDLDIESYPRLTIETLGDAGLRYRLRKAGRPPGRWAESRAFPVHGFKDAAGSGDWCTAGILSRLAINGYKGFSQTSERRVAEAIRFGQALAAWNCRYEGARGGMYAITKQKFKQQIEEILSGTTGAISAPSYIATDAANSSRFCRVCEVPSAGLRKKKARS